MNARGYTLTETTAAVVLLGTFLFAGVQLYRAVTQRVAASGEHVAVHRRTHHALRQLREDVWSADRLQVVAGGRTLRVTHGDRQTQWSQAPDDGSLARQHPGEPPQTWSLQPIGLRFQATPAGVEVRLSAAPDHGESILMIQQSAALP